MGSFIKTNLTTLLCFTTFLTNFKSNNCNALFDKNEINFPQATCQKMINFANKHMANNKNKSKVVEKEYFEN
jgi:hypothetical protein